MPEAKKQTLSLKNNSVSKNAFKFIWKKGTEPSSKMPEAKKTNTLFEKAILFQKEELNITYSDYIEYPMFKFYVEKKYIEYCHPTRPPQIPIENYWRNGFCSFWQDLGFVQCFLLFEF